METLSYKTVSVNKERADKKWFIVDATDKHVGRLASTVAKVIRGKYKTSYTPHADCGDNIIIINSEKTSTRYKILEVSTAESNPRIRVERVEGIEPIPVGIGTLGMEITPSFRIHHIRSWQTEPLI